LRFGHTHGIHFVLIAVRIPYIHKSRRTQAPIPPNCLAAQPPPSAKDALYVSTGLSPNSLLTFVFDTATGTFGSPTTIAGAPAGIDTKVYPGGTFLYVSDFNSGSIFAYSIDRSTGALTALAGSPISFPGHTGNGGPIAIDPTGKFFSIPTPPAPSFPTPSILRPDSSLPEPRRSSMTATSRFIFSWIQRENFCWFQITPIPPAEIIPFSRLIPPPEFLPLFQARRSPLGKIPGLSKSF
jgi:hypothetical protein